MVEITSVNNTFDEILAYNNIMYALMFLIFFIGCLCGIVLGKFLLTRF
nr:MAG TPA: Protein of unknown function (DUF1043) [Inoviridae sp.]